MILALGVVIAAHVVPGINFADAGSLAIAVILLSLFNAVLRPILILFTLPFIIVTMGLGIVVINAFLFLFVGRIVDGFTVAGFWPAVGGSLVLSITNFVMNGLMRSPGPRPPKAPGPGGDVIDI
jgi:putative membrane protein